MRLRRIVMPTTAKVGELVEIRAVIAHPMITGHAAGAANVAQRRIVHTFHVSYGGAEIFRAELGPGIAANPLIAFSTVATSTGELVFTWIDDTGEQAIERRQLTVTAA